MKQPQNIPIICGPLSGKKFVQGEKVIKDLIENSYLFGGNAPYVEDLYEQYLEDPSSVDEKWRQYFDRLQQAPAASKPSTFLMHLLLKLSHRERPNLVQPFAR